MKPSELLAQPGAWTQGAVARLADGETCDPRHVEAVSWCLAGAMDRCRTTVADKKALHTELRKGRRFPDYLMSHYNDAPGRTQAEVVALLKEAGL